MMDLSSSVLENHGKATGPLALSPKTAPCILTPERLSHRSLTQDSKDAPRDSRNALWSGNVPDSSNFVDYDFHCACMSHLWTKALKMYTPSQVRLEDTDKSWQAGCMAHVWWLKVEFNKTLCGPLLLNEGIVGVTDKLIEGIKPAVPPSAKLHWKIFQSIPGSMILVARKPN